MFGIWGVITVLGLALVGLVLYTLVIMRKIGTPTVGTGINRHDRPNTALVVIDVQEDFTRRTGKNAFAPAYRDKAIADINQKIAAARTAGEEVVFIKHVFRDWLAIQMMKLIAGGVGTPGRQGLRLDPDLDAGDEILFEKAIGDSFSCKDFESWLEKKHIGTLKLAGLDSCHCVQLTAKGALSRGYQVEIEEAATLTATPEKWPPLKEELASKGAAFA